MICIDNPRLRQNIIRNNKHSKVENYKINMQKFVVFLYANSETAESSVSFTITSKVIRFSGVNLIKEMRVLSIKN